MCTALYSVPVQLSPVRFCSNRKCHYPLATLGFANLAAAFHSFYRVWVIKRAGQGLLDRYRDIREVIEDLKVDQLGELDPQTAGQFDLLISRLSSSAPLRPLDLFDVNLSGGITLAGSIFTYMIILLQFKIAEDGG